MRKPNAFIALALSPVCFAAICATDAGCVNAALPAAGVVAQATPADTKPIPENGVPMIAGNATQTLMFSGTPAQGSGATVAVTGQRFTEAGRFTVAGSSANAWDVQATVDVSGTVKKGDVMFASFYVRAIAGQAETGEARTQFVFEQQGEPWTKFSEVGVSVGKKWTHIQIPIQMHGDAPAKTHVCFRLGYGKQTVEIADFQLLNFGDRVKFADLPRTRSTYKGIEANATWRKAADARIEKIRKGGVVVLVKNAAGKPVENANISLAQTRHAFGFGTAISAEMIDAPTPDGDKYRDWVTKYCSKVVIENDLKWDGFEQDPARAVRVVKWANDRGIPVRGHNLVWPSYRNLPGDIRGLAGDKAKLAKRIDDHITQEVTALKGRIVEWDVVNEPFDNHDLQDVLGGNVLAHWFTLTKSLDPKPRLTLNDYPPLDGTATENAHLNHFYNTLATLQKQKAPLEGIGFQGHFGGTMIAPMNVLSGLDRFAKLGLPISITEFDMNTSDAGLQSAYMRDFLTATFSHPAVDSVIMWGFWEGRHWLPDAALFSRDWTIRPHGVVFQDLVRKTWWTTASGVTSDKGAYATRGFFGDYTITVTLPGGKRKTVPATITKGAKNTIVVVM